ncbi:uncharacterized protein LOC106662922 isoform X1 [Cimex lectularius]|uniref:Uncharacterized protein n=1 Tax=Cimex lectularius TaxID=79782 RepID=A0A8I6RDQ7_CIMLE|nr:uncharacterized protein LOC106662922 isoform X1 [Cimex lectularius]
MRFFIVLAFFINCTFRIVHCRPGVHGLLDYSTDASKKVVDVSSHAVIGALGLGNKVVQFGSELASKSLEGTANLSNSLIDLSTWIKTKTITTKASVFKYLLGKLARAAEVFEPSLPVISSVIKLIAVLGELMVRGIENAGLTGVKIEDFVSKANVAVLHTIGEVNIKAAGGVAALATLKGQLLTTGVAAFTKTMFDTLAKWMYKGLSYFVTPPQTDLPTYHNSGWYTNFKRNSANSTYNGAPYFINTITRFLNTI